jgi:hypothetical protein
MQDAEAARLRDAELKYRIAGFCAGIFSFMRIPQRGFT